MQQRHEHGPIRKSTTSIIHAAAAGGRHWVSEWIFFCHWCDMYSTIIRTRPREFRISFPLDHFYGEWCPQQEACSYRWHGVANGQSWIGAPLPGTKDHWPIFSIWFLKYSSWINILRWRMEHELLWKYFLFITWDSYPLIVNKIFIESFTIW